MKHRKIKYDTLNGTDTHFQALQFKILKHEYIIPQTKVSLNYWHLEEIVDNLNSGVKENGPKWFVCGKRTESFPKKNSSFSRHAYLLYCLDAVGVMPSYFFEKGVVIFNPFITQGFSDWKKYTEEERDKGWILDRSLKTIRESVFFVRELE